MSNITTTNNLVDATGLNIFFDQIYTKYLRWIGTCVQQVEGKGLSTEDYTTAEKSKLNAIAAGAQVNVLESVKVNGTVLAITDKAVDITIPAIPTNVSAFTNDAGYLTSHQDVSGKANTADLATVATSGSYEDLTNKPTIPSLSGYATQSYVDDKLEDVLGINASGVSALVTALSDEDSATGILTAIAAKADASSLATVATSGSYNDLTDTPTIPSAITEDTVAGWGFTKNAGTLTSSDISDMATKTWVGQQGYTSNAGTITQVGNTTSGAVTVSSSNNTAAWGSAVTVGSVGGVDLKFTMPGNPDTAPVTSVVGNTGAVTAAQIATALTNAGYKLTDEDTKYSAGTALTLSGTTFSMTSANVSTALNLLSTGSDIPVDADYYIAQWAGGGTSATSYHRRPVSKLYEYIKGKLDSVYQAKGTYLTSHQDISGKQNKIPMNTTAGTTGTIALDCDTMYDLGTLTGNITFTLNAAPDSTYMHEWMFSFDVGSTAYTVTMPAGVTFPSTVSIAANKHYEVNIKGTYGLIASW